MSKEKIGLIIKRLKTKYPKLLPKYEGYLREQRNLNFLKDWKNTQA